jgi:hypothetical protein
LSAINPYEPVPVEVAREIAEKYHKSIVIIFAHDPVHGLMHTTTYGTDPQNKAWAAQGGEIATKALGGIPQSDMVFEDYRLEQARKLLAVLRSLANQATGFLSIVDLPQPRERQHSLQRCINDAAFAIKEAEDFL